MEPATEFSGVRYIKIAYSRQFLMFLLHNCEAESSILLSLSFPFACMCSETRTALDEVQILHPIETKCSSETNVVNSENISFTFRFEFSN